MILDTFWPAFQRPEYDFLSLDSFCWSLPKKSLSVQKIAKISGLVSSRKRHHYAVPKYYKVQLGGGSGDGDLDGFDVDLVYNPQPGFACDFLFFGLTKRPQVGFMFGIFSSLEGKSKTSDLKITLRAPLDLGL